MIAALFVETDGIYWGMHDVDVWDVGRDARLYQGPHSVVAHPPCERWGRFWHGSPRRPHQFSLGDDGGCFASALASVRRWGGVIEHPADSHAWHHFGLRQPLRHWGWVDAGDRFGATCYVEQGFYGHAARKPTWLYVSGYSGALPDLNWSAGEQRLDPKMVAKHGYEYARRKGLVSMVGGKHKKQIRNATPVLFRDLLISIAEQCEGRQ